MSTITKAITTLWLPVLLFFSSSTLASDFLQLQTDATSGMTAIFVCMGLYISCAFYSIFVAIDSGERSHLYFGLSALSLIWLWGEIGNIVNLPGDYSLIALFLLVAVNALFIERFLYMARHAPRLSRYLRLFSILVTFSATLIFVLPGLAALVGVALLLLVVVIAVISSAVSFQRGMRSALYSGCGFLLLGGSIAWALLDSNATGIFSDVQVTVMAAGCALFLLFLAFGLVDKFTSIAKRNIASSESLEQKVVERAEQLQNANADLEKLAEDLRAASEAKNTFLVNMSHEMRTPLTAIIGYADGIVQGDIVEQEQTKAMSVIRKNGDHLLNIINDLLDISKIETNSLEIHMKPFDPLLLLQDLSALVAAEIDKKQLKFSVLYRLPLPCEMISDAMRVRQILLNIINNAIKFTHQGEIEVMMKVEQSNVIFSVADTGIGMNQSQMDQLFQAFSQEDFTKSRQYGGVGLGLSIAQSLANKLDAKIEVASTQGQGSTFTITFALNGAENVRWIDTQTDLNQWLIKQAEKNQQKVPLPELNGHVLLAEDHPDNQQLFIRMLERMGLTVTAVDNGYKAVQATLDEDFDVILMDIQMPEMDGLKAFELIQGTGSSVPVIALTANAMQADVDLYMGMGFKDHIAKPVNRQNFVETIVKYLNINRPLDIEMDVDEMDEIKQQYVVRLVKRVADIKAARDMDDWEDIGKHAHAIKGSAGMFGFDELGKMGANLELSVKNGEQALCHSQLQQLLQLCEQITAKQK